MIPSEKNPDFVNMMLQRTLIAFSVIGTFMMLGWLLKYSAYGIDFTDESFYLVWISNPFIYDVSVYLFGFVYHPLFSLLGGDIVALRQANILITFGLAWGLVYVFLASLALDLKEDRVILLTISAGLATSAFILFASWILTPSYNSLALQSLLVSAIGLVLAEKTSHRTSMIGWLLIGVGGWLTFMAKPSTTLALAVGVFFYLLFSRKLSIRMLLLAVLTALAFLLVSALLIDGSVLRFVERIQLGIEFLRYMGSGHTLSEILRVDSFNLEKRIKLAILLVFVALLISIWSMLAKNKKWQFMGLSISIAFFAITALITLVQIHQTADFGQFPGLLIFSLFYAAVIAGLILGRIKTLSTITSSQWTIACLFLAMPHIYAFGTNGNYWQAGSSAAIFWLLAGLILLGPLVRERASWLLALPLAIAAQAVTAILLQTGFEQPYRQTQPLRLNASTLKIGPKRSALVLSEGYAKYVAGAVATAQEAGFELTTPVIDLSGQSPGILYALGAENIGQAWTIGGYPGSLKLAESALARTACEKIANAWVLFEQDGPRSIPTELIPALGADFPGGYKLVGIWQTAEGAGGYAVRRTQELYKPVTQKQTLMTCQTLRTKGTK